MIRTWRGRGLLIVAAVPLLGVVPMADVAGAKPPPRPRTDAKAPEGVVLRTAGPTKVVVPGRAYPWTWTFRVTGKSRAKSGKAVFRTRLPNTLAFVSGAKGCASRGRKVVCDLGTVRRGHRIRGVIRAKVLGRAKPGGTIRLRGTVTWRGTRVTRRFPDVRVARTADLAIVETAPSKARAGTRIRYELGVRNLGPATADSVTVESRGPIRLVGHDTACLRRGRDYVCAVGSLRAGQSRSLRFQAVPRGNVRAGTVLESSWRATSPTADADESNNRAVVRTRITGRP